MPYSSLEVKYVCSGHFSDESYSNKKACRLKETAVPTENLVGVFSEEAVLNCVMGMEIGSIVNTSAVTVLDKASEVLLGFQLRHNSSTYWSKDLRCLEWIGNSGNEELWTMPYSSLEVKYVCSGHFSDESYSNKKACRLKKTAVPTENLVGVFSEEAVLNCVMGMEIGSIVNTSAVTVLDKASEVLLGFQLRHNSSTLSNHENIGSNCLNVNSRRSCCFVGCDTVGPSTFHKFPKVYSNGRINFVNLKRCGAWVEASGNESLLDISSSQLCKKYVCSSHFDDGAFIDGNRMCKRLRVDAIPSKHIVKKLSSDIMKKFPVWDMSVIDKDRTRTVSDLIDENIVQDGRSTRSVSFNYDSFQKKFEDHMRFGYHVISAKKDFCIVAGDRKSAFIGLKSFTVLGLSYVEEQLIARFHPVVSLYKIKGHQMGYSGNSINFPPKVEHFAKVLPHKLSDLANIITVRTRSVICPKEFHVRGAKVLEALKWLQKNNKYYHDIVISAENVAMLPDSDNVYEEIKNLQNSFINGNEDDDHVGSFEFPDDLKMLWKNLLWNLMYHLSVSLLKMIQFKMCDADLRCSRDILINPSTFFKHMLRYGDERFAKHPKYRFFALNSMMRWTAISDGNITIISTTHPDLNCPPGVLHPCRKFMSEAVNIRTDLAEFVRKNKKTCETECRFKFPFEMRECTKLEKNACGMYELLTARNDEHLNKFNEYPRQTGANMDISPCLSKEALISYLTKYVTKCETKSKQLDEITKIVFHRTPEDKAAKEAVRKLYVQTCCERDYSAQEVCHLVMGLKLVSAGGREFVSVQTNTVDKWTYVSKRSGKTQSIFFHKYRNRSIELHYMCLWEVAQKYNLPSGKLRSKNAVVMVYPKIRKGNDAASEEAWFRHHNEKKLEEKGTWEELYVKHKDQISKFNTVLSIGDIQCDYDYEETLDEGQTICVFEQYMSVSSMRPDQSCLEETDLGDREIDLLYDWNGNCILQDRSVSNVRSLANYVSDSKAAAQADGNQLVVMPNVTFTAEQSQILKAVQKQINFIKDGGSSTTNFNFCKRLLVQGKAGTGKSLVIHAMQAMIKNALGEDSVMLVAPTGVAALNIGGATLHSKLHENQQRFDVLRGSSAKKFSNEMEKVNFLIVDVYSMIGLTVLGMMERRCREGKGSEEMFGGIFVNLFGDIKQLNPVLDTALYEPPKSNQELSLHGKEAFNSFDGTVIPTTVMRQRDPQFKMLLDRIGCGQVTVEDYEYLKTRFRSTVQKVSPGEIDLFKDSLRLFPQKDSVALTNKDILSKVRNSSTNEPVTIARVNGKHNSVQAAVADSDHADGLESFIYLGKGAKVMLKKKLWTDMGLVNGAIGEGSGRRPDRTPPAGQAGTPPAERSCQCSKAELATTFGGRAGLLVEEGKSYPDDSPTIILCKFPQYKGPTMSMNGVTGIVP
ncbi:LOW QUALITY PROTEIN: ATP-dependent DNA helicase pfh1, partial [Frankliniella fusca]